MNEDKIKKDIEEIETINIELDHRVSKLIDENEHLKQTYKQLYDSIKPTRIRSKEQCDALINQVNQKSLEISDLNVSLQEKDLVITALKDELRKLKGKYLADNVVTKHTIAQKMLKINVEPIAPRLLNNRIAHSDYLRHTKEQAAILRKIEPRHHVKTFLFALVEDLNAFDEFPWGSFCWTPTYNSLRNAIYNHIADNLLGNPSKRSTPSKPSQLGNIKKKGFKRFCLEVIGGGQSNPMLSLGAFIRVDEKNASRDDLRRNFCSLFIGECPSSVGRVGQAKGCIEVDIIKKDRKPSQNDKTEHGMEKTVQNQGQSPKMPKSTSYFTMYPSTYFRSSKLSLGVVPLLLANPRSV
ncbi:hypothetical protein Tco_0834494 [Tanacetum coccineum]